VKRPTARDEMTLGPHHFVVGTPTNVHCDNPALDLNVVSDGKTLKLHTSNYFNVQYSVLNVTLKGDLNPCMDLRGRLAKVEYVESSAREDTAVVVAIEIHN
jgi:hypothetical protein